MRSPSVSSRKKSRPLAIEQLEDRLAPAVNPLAMADAYVIQQGQDLSVPAALGVLANDTSAGSTMQATLFGQAPPGTLNLSPDGSFTYTPPTGFSGTVEFVYHATDTAGGGRTVYTVDTQTDELIAIDRITGAITVVGPIGHDMHNVDLTFLGNTLYAVTSNSPNLFGQPGFTLVAIDVYTGAKLSSVAVTTVGNAFDPPLLIADGLTALDGRLLIAYDTFDLSPSRIGELNLATGRITFLVDYETVGQFEFDFDGIGSAQTGQLVAVNTEGFSGDTKQIIIYRLTLPSSPTITTVNDELRGNNAIFADLGFSPFGAFVVDPGSRTLHRYALDTLFLQPSVPLAARATFFNGTAWGPAPESLATVTIRVNVAPTAAADLATVPEDSPNNLIDVLDNDTVEPDETPTVIEVGDPAHGTAAIASGGVGVLYTPDPDYFGTDTFTYTMSDGNGGTATASATITVTSVNDNPDAVNDPVTVMEDSSVNLIAVLDNDSSAPEVGETLSVIAVSDPAHGTAVIIPGGSGVLYTPDPDFFGSDTFTYTISDGNGGTDSATVTVTVTNVNDNPDAVEDAPTVFVDSANNLIAVLTNDSIAPDAGETLTVTAVGDPAHGTAVIAPGATGVLYTPDPGFLGTDVFSYTISDGNGGSDTAVVTVTVTNVNNDPTAVEDTATVLEDSEGNLIAVLANDSFAPDVGETLSVTAVSDPAHGTATIVPGGAGVLYTPDPDFFGTDTFTYTIDDGHGGTATATVTVTVNNVNDNPNATDDTATALEDSQSNIIDVLANDSFAPDAGEFLTVTSVSDPAHGSATIILRGAGVLYTPDPDYFGTDTFTYTISDGNGGTDTATVTITVNNVNDNPNATDDTATVPEDSVDRVINVLTNDSVAPDAGETLTVTAVSDPGHGTATVAPGGSGVRYTPDPDFFGTDTFTYTISDGNGGADTATVTVTVNDVNDSPNAVADTATFPEDSTDNLIDVLANDTIAPDTGEGLTVIAVSDPAHGSASIALRGAGVLYTPDPDFFGTDTFTYTIRDSRGGTDTATVTVTVNNVNDNPNATDDTATVSEDSSGTSIVVLTNDTFTPDVGETLSVTVVSDPAHGTATIAPGGSALLYTPDADYFGTDTFTYVISDGNGGTDSATVTVTVTNVNDNPTAVADSVSVSEDTTNNLINVLANDTVAPDAAETLTVTAVSDPTNGTASIAPGGAGVLYTPDPDFFGTDTFTYTIGDGNGGTSTATVAVTVNNVNDSPNAVAVAATVLEDSRDNLISVLNNASINPDGGETLTVIAVSDPAHGTAVVAPGGAGVLYTPDPDFFGTDTFTYTISDGNGGTATATATVTVSPRGEPSTVIAVGTDAGVPARVRLLDGTTRALIREFAPYDDYDGGVRVALGDVNNDGVDDVITSSGGAVGHIKAFDGRTGALLRSFLPFGAYPSALSIGAGDLDGDGFDDIVVGIENGPTHVKAYSGRTGGEILSFFAYAGFSGGVRVAVGDLDGDGDADVATVAGPGGNGHLKGFDGRSLGLLHSSLAYVNFSGAIGLAVAHLSGGPAIVTAAVNPAAGVHVRARGIGGADLLSYFAPGLFGPTGNPGQSAPSAARVAAGDVNGDGIEDLFLTTGSAGTATGLLVQDAATLAALDLIFAFGPQFNSGAFVA